MKKGSHILLLICMLSVCVVIGIFIGRNSAGAINQLPEGISSEIIGTTEEPYDYRLDINSASKIQLMDLPGIGEAIAQRIIDYRSANGPFQTTEDLLNIEGIGKKKLLQIEAFIRVGG